MSQYHYIFLLQWGESLLRTNAFLLLGATAYLYTSVAAQKRMGVTPFSLFLVVLGCCATLWRPFYILGSTLVVFCLFKRWRLFLGHFFVCCAHIALFVVLQGAKHEALKAIFANKKHTVHAVVQECEPWHRCAHGAQVTLRVTHIDSQPLAATIRCFLYRPPRFTVGQTICIYRLQANAQKEQAAHLTAYNIRDNIAGTVFAPFLSHRILCPWSIQTLLFGWRTQQRNAVFQSLRSQLSSDVLTFVGALFFGNKNHPDYATVRRSFTAWGLSHYLARSGLHIALIIMFLSFFCCSLACPYWLSFALISLFLWWYWLLSWSSISFIRALALWLLYAGGIALHRRPHSFYLLSLTTLGTLLFEPYNGFCIDFQLSFFLTAVLILQASILHNQFQPLLAWRRAN